MAAVFDDTIRFHGEHKQDDNYDEHKSPSNHEMFDVRHEEYLKQTLLDIIFKFDTQTWTDIPNTQKGISCHYKFITSTSYTMRASMDFVKKHNNIIDYYYYLDAGYNDDALSWVNNKSENKILAVFDKDHQLMYNKGNGGILNLFISPRDTCYMRTRFKQLNYKFKNTYYDIIASLHYSVNKNHPQYYPQDKKCVRVNMKYRGYLLIRNNTTQKIQLMYTSYFDIKGSIPQWLTENGIKGIPIQYITQFYDSWEDKMKCLKQREADIAKNELKRWIEEDVKLPQYADNFLKNGFDDKSYLKFDLTENDLKDIGINLKGHRLKILNEIKKL